MRRVFLLMGVLIVICHVALGGIMLVGRINDAAVCLQYRTYNAAEPVFGVIDANTGTALIDRGRSNWTYVYGNERYYLVAKRHDTGYAVIQNQSYATYDLAITPSDPYVSGRRPFTLLQEGVLIPVVTNQLADSMLYQFLYASLITTPGQIALRWLDHNLQGFLTLVNEDGSNPRVVALNALIGLSTPIAWSADARYILLRTEQATRYKPYTILDVQTLQPITLPSELRLPDATTWQSAVWSPTQSQIAAIRPANGDISDNPSLVAPLQLVLFSPADGTTQIIDLPPHFYAQEIVWSPNGQSGVLVGLHALSDDGRSSRQDSKGYVLFTATGKLTSDIRQGITYPQLQGQIALRLGTWSFDGSTWLYLRNSTIAPNDFLELIAINSDTHVAQVLESRLTPEWWVAVFNDTAASPTGFGRMPPAFRQDIVLITRNADNRLNLDLLDTLTMKRTNLASDVDRLALPSGQLSGGGSAFRMAFYAPYFNTPPAVIFDALVEKDNKSTFVWSALDGSNHHELPIDADSFEINSGWGVQHPTLIYRLKHDDQTNIGKIDVYTGAQIDLLKSLTYVADSFTVIPFSDTDRVGFTTTNIRTGSSDLYLSALDGSFSKQLATLILPNPIWSADGSQLAYMTMNNGRFKVSFVDRDGTLLREVTTNIKLMQKFQGVYLGKWTKCPE